MRNQRVPKVLIKATAPEAPTRGVARRTDEDVEQEVGALARALWVHQGGPTDICGPRLADGGAETGTPAVAAWNARRRGPRLSPVSAVPNTTEILAGLESLDRLVRAGA
jgi:hypothetical protein